MPAAPATLDDFLSLLGKSGLIAQDELNQRLEHLRAQGLLPDSPSALAKLLVQEGILTPFHTSQLLAGKSRGFLLGSKYKVLERLGAGGMGAVFLCEHVVMRRLVAVKILPPDQANSESALERFHREARAVAQLKHPNIVAAHDVDQEGKLHFLVMEFVDGNTLDRIVRKSGPLPLVRACHYIRQAAEGLQHAHEAGLVHRDIKPANLLLGRDGILKLLDMGLARFFHDSEDNLTRDHEAHSMLGTADYMAPEQAINSTGADIRSDIYGLGGTFYFLLAGESPFAGRSTAQKLMMHQLLTPTRIREVRAEIPPEIEDLIATLLEKDPARRLQTPAEVVSALAPWTDSAIAVPDDAEMPNWPPAIRALLRTDSPSGTRAGTAPTVSGSASPTRVQPSGGFSGLDNPSPSGETFPEDLGIEKPNGSGAFQSASRVRKMSRTPRPRGPGGFPPALSPLAGSAPESTALQTTPSQRSDSLSPGTGGATPSLSLQLPVPTRGRLLLWVGIGLGVIFLGVMLGTIWLLTASPKPQAVVAAKADAGPARPREGEMAVVPAKPPEDVPKPRTIVSMRPERILKGHTDAVESVCFCAGEGNWLVSGSRDKTMRLWETGTGKEVRPFLHPGPVRGVAVLPDKRRALTACSDKTIRLWNLWTGDPIRMFNGHTGEVQSVACLPDGVRFISAGKDWTLRLWNADTGAELKVLTGHQGPVFGLDVSPDGRQALSGGQDRTVRRWDLEEGKEIDQLHVPGPVHRVKFSIDGRMAVLGCGNEVWEWDLVENQVRPIDGPISKAAAVTFSADSRYILAGGDDKLVRLWDTALGKQRLEGIGQTNRIADVSMSPDGQHAASCGPDKTICLWRLPVPFRGVFVGEVRELTGHTNHVECVAWTPDGRKVLSTSLDKTMCLWDVATGKLLLSPFKGHTGALRGLAILPDGKRAVSASTDKADRSARLWDLETGKEIRRFEGHTNGVHWIQCSSDGSRLLSAGKDGFLRMWSIESGKELKGWQAYTDSALTVAYLPDGKRAVSGGIDKDEANPKGPAKYFVRLWNLETEQLIEQRQQSAQPWRVDVSPAGQLVAITDKSSIRLWDLQTGQVRLIDVRVPGTNAGIASCVFSPDGRTVMCGCHDGSVRLLDVATGKELRRLDKHTNQALGVAFSPDGRMAASGGRDNTIRIWQLPEFVAARKD